MTTTRRLASVLYGGGGAADSAPPAHPHKRNRSGRRFVVVYPQGSAEVAGKLKTWNAGTCCGEAMQQRIDEIAFVAALLDDLPAALADLPAAPAVDSSRVYATCLSNGGMMAYEVACALADRRRRPSPALAAR